MGHIVGTKIRRWTQADEDTIRACVCTACGRWHTGQLQAIAAQLGRSYGAVVTHAGRIGQRGARGRRPRQPFPTIFGFLSLFERDGVGTRGRPKGT